jgi:hypothetical protein
MLERGRNSAMTRATLVGDNEQAEAQKLSVGHMQPAMYGEGTIAALNATHRCGHTVAVVFQLSSYQLTLRWTVVHAKVVLVADGERRCVLGRAGDIGLHRSRPTVTRAGVIGVRRAQAVAVHSAAPARTARRAL